MNPIQDTFITIPTENEQLKPYISFFYFHSCEDEQFKKAFTYFPNFKHAITVYQNSKSVRLSHNRSKVVADNKMNVLFSMNYSDAIKVELNGKFSKIGIVFHPLGLNHFIKDDLNKIYDAENKIFNYYGFEFENILSKVFSSEKTEEKRQLLEDFFISKLQPISFPLLKPAIELLFEHQANYKVEEIATTLKTNRKQLFRLFQKHLGCSPETYRKMLRFRNAFNQLQIEKNKTLTEISLFNHYYDQADFNRQFKAITHEQPKKLMPKITHVGNEDTYWKFEEVTH